MRRLGTIIEYMAEVRITFGTRNCDSDHAITHVSGAANVLGGDRLPEARPACSGIELGLRAEQRAVAANAPVQTFVMQVPILSRVCDFGIGVTRYVESAGR